MFDSAFDDWAPGRARLFGWPWHGRVDLVGAPSSPTQRVTLPNGSLFNMGQNAPPRSAHRLAQPGNLLRFRDPRAADPVRTAEQLAADIEAGREWRADALFSPQECMIYGARFAERLIYSDGETVWLTATSSLLSGVVYLYHGPRISRNKSPGRVAVDVSFPEGAPEPLLIPSTFVAIDSMPAGNKVLFARLSAEANSMPEGTYDPSLSTGQAWRVAPIEFWELAIQKDGDDHSAVFRPVSSIEATKGVVTPREPPELQDAWISLTIDWSSANAGPGLYTWTGEAKAELRMVDPGGETARGIPRVGNYNLNYGHTGRVVSMFYRADGSIERVTLDTRCTESYSSSLSFNTSETKVVGRNSNAGGPGGAYWSLITPGTLNLTTTGERSRSLTIRMALRTGGVTLSESVMTSSGSGSVNLTSSYILDGLSIGPRLENASQTQTHTVSHSASFQGSEVLSDGGTFTSTVASENTYAGPWFLPPAPEFDSAWVTMHGQMPPETSRPRARCGPVFYCAQMPALCIQQAADEKWWVGRAVTPAGVAEGLRTGVGPIPELFGSYNPVTKQVIRDADNPVRWV